LDAKEAALSAVQQELSGLRAAACRMLELEAELASSSAHLLVMDREVEAARSASCRIECVR
jgi:hypothetical protein